MSRRYLIEIEAPDFLTARNAIKEMVSHSGITLKSVQKCSLQQVIDDAHAIRDAMDERGAA